MPVRWRGVASSVVRAPAIAAATGVGGRERKRNIARYLEQAMLAAYPVRSAPLRIACRYGAQQDDRSEHRSDERRKTAATPAAAGGPPPDDVQVSPRDAAPAGSGQLAKRNRQSAFKTGRGPPATAQPSSDRSAPLRCPRDQPLRPRRTAARQSTTGKTAVDCPVGPTAVRSSLAAIDRCQSAEATSGRLRRIATGAEVGQSFASTFLRLRHAGVAIRVAGWRRGTQIFRIAWTIEAGTRRSPMVSERLSGQP
jgi:hypothetical protein